MPQKYLFTTDADSWWLRFSVSVSGQDLSTATVSGASLGLTPGGEYGSGTPDSQSFSVTTKQSDGTGAWYSGGTAYFDSAAGFVDVPLTRLTARMFVGERLFVRLFANAEPDIHLASAELAIVKDTSVKQDALEDAVACEGDEYLSFRLSESGGFEESYVGPRLMSGGSVFEYQLLIRPTGTTQWDESPATYHDELTGLVDCAIASAIAQAQPGASFDYKVIEGNSGPTVVQGVMIYDPDCEPDDGAEDPPKRYDITATAESRDLMFRLANYDPDPSQAVVVSVAIGRSPAPITGGIGVFFLRYRVDESPTWNVANVAFDEDEGVAAINITAILANAETSVEYKLIYDAD